MANASKELKNADIVLNQTGHSMIQFGLQAAAAFGYVVSIGARFEKEMSFIQAVTNATDADMAKLRDTAIELGKNGPFGPIALAQSFVELAKAGVSAQDIVDGVGQSVVDLAGAADITAEEAGNIIVQTMSQFGLMAKEVPRATDIIAGAANASMIDVQDFAVTLRYAGPVAAALGIELEDLATTIAVLGQSGIRGSMAGTSLRQTFLNLEGATAKARGTMKELGIITEDGTNIFYDQGGQLKDLTTIFELLGQKLDGLTEKQKTTALRDIFGVRQMPTVLYLLEQGRAKFEEFNEEINKVTAADVAEKRLDNLDGAIKRFKATLESVLLGPSTPFQKMLQGIVEGATKLLKAFGDLPPGVQTFLLGLVGVIAVLSLFSGAFLLTIGSIVRAVRVIGELRTAFSVLLPMVRSAAAAAKGFTLALAANPIVLIILALILLGVALYHAYRRFEGFQKVVDETWQTIQQVWDDILGFFRDTPGKISKAWDEITKDAEAFWDTFEGIFTLPSGGLGGLGGLKDEFSKVFEGLGNTGLGDIFSGVGDSLTNLPDVLGGALDGIGSVTEVISNNFPQAVGNGMTQAAGFIQAFISNGISSLITGGGSFVNALLTGLTELIPRLGELFANVLGNLGFFIGQMVGSAVRLGIEFVVGLMGFLQQLPFMIWSLLTNIFTTLVTWVPQLVGQGIQLGSEFLSGVLSFFNQLPGRVVEILTNVLNTIIGFVPRFLQGAVDLGNAVFDGVWDGLSKLPGVVTDVLGNVIDAFKGIVGEAFDAAASFGGGLWEGFKSGLGISSPSYIEEALFAIQDEAARTGDLLEQSVRNMNLGSAPMVKAVNSGAVGLPTPSAVANAGDTHLYQAPLVGEAVIRDDRDIVTLARELEKERLLQARARGKKV